MDAGRHPEVVEHLLAFMEQTPDFVGVSDPWGRILYLNPAARKRLGVGASWELTLADLFPPEEFAFYYEVVRPELIAKGAWSGEVLVKTAGSEPVSMYVCATGRIGPGGETNGGVVYARDLERAPGGTGTGIDDPDELTGLLVRTAFEERADSVLANARRVGDSCAMVVAEVAPLDPPPTVDRRDWSAVMRALGNRLTDIARSNDVAGRVGERRFALLIPGIRARSEALRMARMVTDMFTDPPVTTSGGEIALSVRSAATLAEARDMIGALLERALELMQTSSADAPHDTAHRGHTLEELSLAMSHGQLVPYIRPVCELASGERVAYQGILRWQHPSLGLLHFEEFADAVGDTPVGAVIDRYLARETAAAALLSAPPLRRGFYVAVSRQLVADVRAERHFSEIADAFSLALESMRLQLPLHAVSTWSRTDRHALYSLHEAGMHLVATGIDTVEAVRAAALGGFDEVELAPALTEAASLDSPALEAVRSVSSAARDVGCDVKVRGVRNAGERGLLAEAGCEIGDGAVFGAAVRSDTVE